MRQRYRQLLVGLDSSDLDSIEAVLLPLQRVERHRGAETVLVLRCLVLQPLSGEVHQRRPVVNVIRLQHVLLAAFVVLVVVIVVLVAIVVLVLFPGVRAHWPDLGKRRLPVSLYKRWR